MILSLCCWRDLSNAFWVKRNADSRRLVNALLQGNPTSPSCSEWTTRARATHSMRWWASSHWRTSSRRSSSQRSWMRQTSTVCLQSHTHNRTQYLVSSLKMCDLNILILCMLVCVCPVSWQSFEASCFSPRAEAAGLLHLQTVREWDESEDLSSASPGNAPLPLHR